MHFQKKWHLKRSSYELERSPESCKNGDNWARPETNPILWKIHAPNQKITSPLWCTRKISPNKKNYTKKVLKMTKIWAFEDELQNQKLNPWGGLKFSKDADTGMTSAIHYIKFDGRMTIKNKVDLKFDGRLTVAVDVTLCRAIWRNMLFDDRIFDFADICWRQKLRRKYCSLPENLKSRLFLNRPLVLKFWSSAFWTGCLPVSVAVGPMWEPRGLWLCHHMVTAGAHNNGWVVWLGQ